MCHLCLPLSVTACHLQLWYHVYRGTSLLWTHILFPSPFLTGTSQSPSHKIHLCTRSAIFSFNSPLIQNHFQVCPLVCVGVCEDLTPARKYKQKATEKNNHEISQWADLWPHGRSRHWLGWVWGMTKVQSRCFMSAEVIGDKRSA